MKVDVRLGRLQVRDEFIRSSIAIKVPQTLVHSSDNDDLNQGVDCCENHGEVNGANMVKVPVLGELKVRPVELDEKEDQCCVEELHYCYTKHMVDHLLRLAYDPHI
jgi:hypothetical protein